MQVQTLWNMGKERATLPFERSEGYSQHESKPSTNVTQGASNKKRIEVFVSPELAHEVVAAIRELEQGLHFMIQRV